ncbi:MAG: hypothetical protein RI894_2536 [Bacteroidota bacterium]
MAVAKNNIIGADNQIPWYLPADLAYFKRCTQGHPIIMGRNCFESIGRPLPNRLNIVVTRNPFFIANGVVIAHTVAEAIDIAKAHDENEIFIIGGGEIYRQTQNFWQRLYLTEVDIDIAGDVIFPAVNLAEWQLVKEESHQTDAKNEHNYTFKVFELMNTL